MLSCLWDNAYKRIFAANWNSSPCGGSGFPLSLSEWSFTICPTPYNRKYNVLSTSLNKTLPEFYCYKYSSCLFVGFLVGFLNGTTVHVLYDCEYTKNPCHLSAILLWPAEV